MTLKDRILSWFNKENDIQELVLFDKDEEYSEEDFEEELKLWDDIPTLDIGSKYIDKDAVEGKKVIPNLEELIAGFKDDVPGKKAIWGGKETIAFKKWKADNNWD